MCSASVTTLVTCDRLESRTPRPQAHMEAVGTLKMRRQPAQLTCFELLPIYYCPEPLLPRNPPSPPHPWASILLLNRGNRIVWTKPITSSAGSSCSLRWSAARLCRFFTQAQACGCALIVTKHHNVVHLWCSSFHWSF